MNSNCLGLSHRTAPLELLEQAGINSESMVPVLERIRRDSPIEEIAGLSTCNRTEIYYVAPPDWTGAREHVLNRMYEHIAHDTRHEINSHAYQHTSQSAARHLLRLASGADSLILGETEILGQIQNAFRLADENGFVGETLRALLTRSVAFGRRVRVETDICKGHVSFASVSYDIANEVFDDISNRCVVIVGAGEIARVTAQHYWSRGVGSMMILNRTFEKARELAATFHATAMPFDHLNIALAKADIVVYATGAQEYLMTRDEAVHLMKARRTTVPKVFIDLCRPRNIDPAVAEVQGIRLAAMNEIKQAVESASRTREAALPDIESLVDVEIAKLTDWLHSRQASKLVTAVRRRMDDICQSHVNRYGKQFDERHRACLSKFSQSLLNTLMHDITMNIRQLDMDTDIGKQEFDLACQLFNITQGELDT